jgi:hypothetical protein
MIRVIMTAVMAIEKVKTRKRGVDHQGLVIKVKNASPEKKHGENDCKPCSTFG